MLLLSRLGERRRGGSEGGRTRRLELLLLLVVVARRSWLQLEIVIFKLNNLLIFLGLELFKR